MVDRFPKLPTEGTLNKRLPKRTTSNDLYQLAVQSGFQEEADNLLAQKGENAKEIFSGGLISDVFDALNAVGYGVVGLLKGKSFSEGVRTRQSFSDKDALGNHGIPGVIGGILLDIAADPLTYVAPWTILKHIPGAAKMGKAVKGLFTIAGKGTIAGAEKILPKLANSRLEKAGHWLTRNIVGAAGADEVFGRSLTLSKVATVEQRNSLKKMVNYFSTLDDDLSTKIPHIFKEASDGRQILKSSDEIARVIGGESGAKAQKLAGMIEEAEGALVDLNVVAEKHGGEYFHNMYMEHLEQTGKAQGFTSKGLAGSDVLKKTKLIYETPEQIAKKVDRFGEAFVKKNSTVLRESGEVIRKSLFPAMPKNLSKAQQPAYRALTKKIAQSDDALARLAQNPRNFPPGAAEALIKRDTRWKQELVDMSKGKGALVAPPSPKRVAAAQKKIDRLQEMQGRGVKRITDKAAKNKLAVQAKRAELGEIKDSFLPLVVTLEEQLKLVENGKLFRGLARTHAVTDDFIKLAKEAGEEIPLEGYTKIPKRSGAINKWGDLEDKYIPTYVFDALTEIQKVKGPAERMIGKGWGYWKWAHTAGNFATHVRNAFSNQILNFWKLGMNPVDPRTIKSNAIAIKEMAKGGKWLSRAQKQGWNINTYAGTELRDAIWRGPEMIGSLKKAPGTVKRAFNKVVDGSTAVYQSVENQGKLSAFIYNSTYKGMDDATAWLAAEAATFDYSAVGPLVRKMREQVWGLPFLTFTVKATPVAIETALKHPQRIGALGKIKNTIENQADIKKTARERASEPQWIKDGFYVKLPMKDKHGRSAYFDMTYIIPFGDLASGQFFERQIDRETGLPESVAEAAIKKSPLINLITELSKNQDFYGNNIWKPTASSVDQIADMGRHVMKAMAPPILADTLPGGYLAKGKNKGKRRPSLVTRAGQAGEGNQYRTGMQEFIRNLGMKVQPIEADLQETYMEWEKKRTLESLLKGKGVLNEYTRTYQPKQ